MWLTAAHGDSGLITTGSFASNDVERDHLRIVTYNLHGPATRRVPQLIQLLKTHPELSVANILALQETNRNSPRSGNHDIASLLAAELGMHFAYATEQVYRAGWGERGLALLSDFPLSDVSRITLPVTGPGGRRRIALSANVDLGLTTLRIVNAHLETRITPKARAEQMQALLANSVDDNEPMIILGDFNTFTARHTRTMTELMQQQGFDTPMGGDVATFRTFVLLRLKLDWIWLRGIPPLATQVESNIKVSDHRPVWVDVDIEALGNSRVGVVGVTGAYYLGSR